MTNITDEEIGWKGSQFDEKGFQTAVKERWEKKPGGVVHCKTHNTWFTPAGPDGEPCWQCFHEFDKET